MNTYRDPGALMPSADPTPAPAPPPPPQSDREAGHGHIGLVNQGCTCYLSSMLQFLFHIGYFRSAVYATSIAEEDPSPIPRALQALFFQMQERQTTGTTVGLTNSFGWGDSDLYVQHDIHEMVTKLREVLEEKMKGTPSEGAINRLFEGKGENVIETMDGSYTSRRPETFYDIILAVTDYKDLYSSLASHCEKTQLVGDCKYKVEVEGEEPVYKDAEKGYRFVRFPPVMCFHLKRFEMDMFSPDLETKKVNSYFEFPEVLDLSEFEVGEEPQAPPTPSKTSNNAEAATPPTSVPLASASDFSKPTAPIYDLHSVIVHKGGYGSGHYYCYVRMLDLVKPGDEPTSHKAEDEEGESAMEGVTPPYTGGQWFEFDDERVRMVKTPVATTDNFGGDRASYGRGGGASAYVLVYLRRGFLPELLMEASPDSIPQRAKDELRRVMLEDERIAIAAAEAKRKVSITLVDDSHLYDHVRTNTTDLIRGRYDDSGKDSGEGAYTKRVHSSGSATHPPGLPRGVAYNHLKIDKSAPMSALYEELANHHGYQPQHIRLWSWSYHYPKEKMSLRPSTALPMYSPDDDTPVEIVLGKSMGMDEAMTRQRYENKPMATFLYVEQRREIVPPTSGNILSSFNEWIDMTEASTAYNPALVPHNSRPLLSHECYNTGFFRYLPRQTSIKFTTYLKKPCYVTDTSFTLLLPNRTHGFTAFAELYASKDDVGKSSEELSPGARVRVANPQQDMPADDKRCQCSHTFPMTSKGLPFVAVAIRFVVRFNEAFTGSPGICITRIQTPSCLMDPLYTAVLKDVSSLPKEAVTMETNNITADNNNKKGSLSARFAAQRVRMPTKGANALDALSVGYAAHAAIPPYHSDADLLLMVKLYSPTGGSHTGEPVRFLGPLVVKKSMCLQDYQSAILRMMGMPAERLVAPRMRKHLLEMRASSPSSNSNNLVISDAAWTDCYSPSLLFYDESSHNQISILDSDRALSTQDLVSGNVIVVQLNVPSVPSIYRFPTAIGYYSNVNTRHMVTIRFHDCPEDPVIQLPMNSAWTYGEVCDFIALKLNHLLLIEEGAEVANSSPTTSNAHSPASPNSSIQLSSRRKKREQHHRDEKHLLLQGENDDESMFHSDYIRLFSTADIITPVPAPDPIRSIATSKQHATTLYDYLDVNDSLAQDLFIEVLSVPRTVLETYTQVTLTPVDEFGCPYLGGGESIAGTTSSASAPKAEVSPSSSADPTASTTPPPKVEDAVSKAAAKEEVPLLLPPGCTFRDIVTQCFVQAGLLKEEEGADGMMVTTAIEGFHLAPHYTIVGVLRDEPSRPVIVHDHIFMDPSLPSAIPPTDLFSRQYRFVLMATEPLPGYDPVKQGPKWDYSHFMDKPDAKKYVRIMCSHTDIVDVAYYRKAKLWGTPFLVTASFATTTDDCMKIMCDVARVQMETLVSGSSKNLAVLLYTNMALHFNECIPVVQYLKHTRQADLPSILVLNHKRPKKAMMATTGHREAALVLERKAPSK